MPARPPREPIAIVGIGCRLPAGVEDPASLFRALIERTDAVTEPPPERWASRRFAGGAAVPGTTAVQHGAYLRHPIRAFDARFFGLSRREAEVLDPQQRLLLESAWESLEDAGIVPSGLHGSRTGVFVGGFLVDASTQFAGPTARADIDSHTGRAVGHTMLSARLAHVLDLRGPTLTVDTACSSSMVALHLACEALWRGECDRALVGGASLLLRPEPFVLLDRGGFLSHDARCRAFDHRGTGYVRGEGALVLFVEPLAEAVAAGRAVYACVAASAVNQDGRTPGITVPSVAAQTALLSALLEGAALAPAQITFVEAHGTGTPVGDPIELEALAAVLGGARADPLWIGSIKTNFGHLEAAAGLAGVAKAALALVHRRLPPSLHFERLREGGPRLGALTVATDEVPLGGSGPLAALVTSYGYGGTNGGVVLLEAPARIAEPAAEEGQGPWVVPLSARSERSLAQAAARLADALRAAPQAVRDVAWSAGTRREAHPARAAVVAHDVAGLLAGLGAITEGAPRPGVLRGESTAGAPVLVYTGMGAQHFGMGAALARADPGFRAALASCERAFARVSGRSLLGIFEAGDRLGRPMRAPRDAQPANLALQVALTRWLGERGIAPAAVLGHSAGEVAAAWAAGVLELDDAFQLAHARGEWLERLSGCGGMLAVVGLEDGAVFPVVEETEGVAVAALNGPRTLVLAGPTAALAQAARRLESAGARCRMLEVDVPYHHPDGARLEPGFRAALAGLAPRSPTVPWYSTVSGARVEALGDPVEHFWQNVIEPSRLRDAVGAAAADGHLGFVEVGPHPALSPALAETLGASRHARVVPTLVRGVPDAEALAATLAALWVGGARPRWEVAAPGGRPIPLPRYAWDREVLWREGETTRRDLHGTDEHPLLQARAFGPELRWLTELRAPLVPYLGDHRLDGRVVFPAAGYVEAALAVAREDGRPTALEDLALADRLDCALRPALRVELERASGRITFLAGDAVRDRDWALLATCRLVSPEPGGPVAPGTTGSPVDLGALYEAFADLGVDYGPAFRTLRGLEVGQDGFAASLALAPPEAAEAGRYLVHPALLDGALQALALAGAGAGHDVYLPVRIARVCLATPLGASAEAIGRVTERGERGFWGTITLLGQDGAPALELAGVRLQRAPAGAAVTRLLHAVRWVEVPAPEARPEGRHVLIGDAPPAGPAAEALRAAGCAVHRVPVERAGEVGGARVVVAVDRLADAARVARALSATSPGAITVLTRGAAAVRPDDAVAALDACAQAAFFRSAALELGAPVRQVDLAPGETPALGALERALAEGPEPELAVRGQLLFARRLVRNPRGVQPGRVPRRDRPAELRSTGGVQGLDWVLAGRRDPGPGEVELEVTRVGLNFKDLLKVQGRLPEAYLDRTHSRRRLGLDAAGVVTRVGAGVCGLAVGDAVLALVPGAFSTAVTASAAFVFPWPRGLAPDAAPCLLPLLTAFHALLPVARLEPGETALVHSAAGAVGQAALAIARWRGARVVATAGSAERRAWLAEQGVLAVADSRSPAFAETVRTATAGRGVDVVLGAVQGELLRRGLEVLAPLGRYVDIGVADVLRNEALPMGLLQRGATFASFDLDRCLHEPAVRRSAEEVVGLLDRGLLDALPGCAFAAEDVRDAFSRLTRPEHAGKVVVSLSPGPASVLPARARAPRLRPDRTYLVTGGLGGLGLEAARWLVRRGARRLCLVGRAGPTPAARAALAALAASGAEVLVRAADAADPAQMAPLLEVLRASGAPLAGILHAAGVVDDAVLAEQDDDRLARVWRGKVEGARVLDALTASDPVELFVLISSIVGVIGNAGQASYAAASAALDAIAHGRRAVGRPALSLSLGPVASVGMLARRPGLLEAFERRGLAALEPRQVFRALAVALDAGAVTCLVADADWSRLARARGFEPWLSELVPGFDAGAPAHATDLPTLRRMLLETVAAVLGTAVDRLDDTRPLADLGVDSLLGMEVVSALRERLGRPIEPALFTPSRSLLALAEALASSEA